MGKLRLKKTLNKFFFSIKWFEINQFFFLFNLLDVIKRNGRDENQENTKKLQTKTSFSVSTTLEDAIIFMGENCTNQKQKKSLVLFYRDDFY